MTSSTFFKAAFLFCAFCLSHILSAQDIKPIKGKWNAGDARDYVGFWKLSQKKGYLFGSGNGTITGITTVLGNAGDLPITLNYQGDAREEIAMYRPSTREMNYFADYSQSSSIAYIRDVGDPGDQVITGDWEDDGVDGYALFKPLARQIWYYHNIDSPPFTHISIGNCGDVPIVGDWDGLNGDGYALYNPSTRQICFYQKYDDTTPVTSWTVGNTGDVVIAGDWDGDGKDGIGLFRKSTTQTNGYEFWLFNTIGDSHSQSIFFTDAGYFADVTGGRQFFYAQKVPHVDKDGNYRTAYDPTLSFFPKGLYHVPEEAYSTVYNAGYNVAFLGRGKYPLTPEGKTALDATGNNLRIIPYLQNTTSLKIPFMGKFTGTVDLPGVALNDNSTLMYYDSDGNNTPDLQFKTGNSNDIPITGDWNGDGFDDLILFRRVDTDHPASPTVVFHHGLSTTGREQYPAGDLNDKTIISGNWDGLNGDGYALYNPDARRLTYYQNYNDAIPLGTLILTAADAEDIIISGDWNGDGKDGYALYKPSMRKFFFYQNYNSTSYVGSQVLGNPGDLPVSGDWDGDGKDGYGVYRSDAVRSRHEYWYSNSIEDNTRHSIIFGNPIFESLPKKYCFGVYTDEEFMGRSESERIEAKTYLDAAYLAYKNYNSEVVFHVDERYFSETEDPAANSWWKIFAQMGEAAAHDPYVVKEPAQNIQTMSHVSATIEQARLVTSENLPNWLVIQDFQDLHFSFYKPTTNQVRASVYTGLIHGATGIFNFAYHNTNFSQTLFGMSATVNADLWNQSILINQELDVLKPYLLSVTSPALYNIATDVVPSYEGLPIRSLLKLVNGYYVLMTVNMTKQPLNAIIQLPTGVAPADRVVERMFEGTTTQTYAGAINDSYGAFGVHVYKFKAPTGGFGGGRARPSEEISEVSKTQPEIEILTVYPVPSKGIVNFEIGNIPDTEVSLVLYNANGEVVKTIRESAPAHKSLLWDGTADDGRTVQPGFYFYKFNGNLQTTRNGKLILIR